MLVVFGLALIPAACNQGTRRNGMPAGAQAALDAAIEDIDAGRYEKLYNEAADEWRKAATLDQSKATFKTLHDKLGNVRARELQRGPSLLAPWRNFAFRGGHSRFSAKKH